MIERIQPVTPITKIKNDLKRGNNHSNSNPKKQSKKEFRPVEGSPSFLEDDLLRREFSGSKFDVKV